MWRTWDEDQPYALIIGLNPSKADETSNDPTITRCINFAVDWGFGGLCVANLFAYCATYPDDLKRARDPIGNANDRWLTRVSKDAGIIVAAWGNDGGFLNRAAYMRGKIKNLHHLKLNKSREPAHPLYLKRGLRPIPWN